MDIIVGIIISIFLFFLFHISKKIPVHKKLTTALISGFIVFVILTEKIQMIKQKLVIVIVALLLLLAVNLKVRGEEKKESQNS